MLIDMDPLFHGEAFWRLDRCCNLVCYGKWVQVQILPLGMITGSLNILLTLQQPLNCPVQLVEELTNPLTRQWNTNLLQLFFPQEVVESILCIPLSARCPSDRITWKLEEKGFFTVRKGFLQ